MLILIGQEEKKVSLDPPFSDSPLCSWQNHAADRIGTPDQFLTPSFILVVIPLLAFSCPNSSSLGLMKVWFQVEANGMHIEVHILKIFACCGHLNQSTNPEANDDIVSSKWRAYYNLTFVILLWYFWNIYIFNFTLQIIFFIQRYLLSIYYVPGWHCARYWAYL